MALNISKKSKQKREEIINSAITLFTQHGYPNTSMQAIAQLANVSKQTIYSHFKNKDHLFISAIEFRCNAYKINAKCLSDYKNPQQTLALFAHYFNQLIISDEAVTVHKTCVSQSDTHPEVCQLFYSAGPENICDLLAQYLTAVESNSDYQFGNAKHAAIRFCLMLYGEMRIKMELGLDTSSLLDERQEYIDGCVNMFLKAYRY